ncbi:ras GTPase-activating protein-binding protein 2 isoform X2 [Cephus cinctus]|uniref:Ras GTPase-activating protein-binding protein 2 isoform X2 n=1 Tax=Cephus cinctus TaxID=211228 RepID=A0AAJ7BKS4_CEPCN|nr:ras GTPase-activating protein-binding protein 2 isoform X2 [Cephus cinctus]
MVMEASPAPQCVGREFVRQYYTLLNKAPAHLHRFYNANSSFVHGGLDAPNRDINPAIGQKQIHQKIQQLNFRDCHAKISQVDSQATLGNGVVVQVTGELSNAGQPMRRFTQTFVLGTQEPKKYYVHNDIFRYQDLVFPDEEEADVEGVESGVSDVGEREAEEGGRSETEEDEQQNQGQQISLNTSTSEHQTPQPALIPNQQPQIQQQQQHVFYHAPQPQQPVHPVMQPVINGSVHEETPLISQQQQQPLPPQPQQQQQQQHSHSYIAENTTQESFSQETESDATADQQQQVDEETQPQAEESQEQVKADPFAPSAPEAEPEQPLPITNTNSSGAKTYANLVKSFPSATGATSPQAPKLSMSPPPIRDLRLDERSPLHPANSGPILSSTSNVSGGQQQAHRVGGNQQPQQHQQQQRAPRGGPVQRDGERRGGRSGQYGDAHQLFLGNLPHHASESDLRILFERYGKVAELRIHSKQNERSKGPQGATTTTRVPNYGFITFEDQQVVSKVLQGPPIYYPDQSGQKLNVEEKKTRPRMSLEGDRRTAGDGNIRAMGGQQQQQQQQPQRGPGGPGGVMRGGGQHGARGGRGGFSRGGDGGRTGGGMRQPGNPSNPSYQNRR